MNSTESKILEWINLSNEQEAADDHTKCPKCHEQLAFCECPQLLGNEILNELNDKGILKNIGNISKGAPDSKSIKNDKEIKVISFLDRYGNECSIIEASFVGEPVIWIGKNNSEFSKMPLTPKAIKKLLPHLQYFADNGRLPSQQDLKNTKIYPGDIIRVRIKEELING